MADEKIKLPSELTDAEIKLYDDKATALAAQRNVSKVHPVVQIDPETFERHVCYLQEPNYVTKIRIMDKATQLGPFSAAEELRAMSVIKEESDPITFGDGPESDRYKMGVTDFCLNLVDRLKNQFKKK